MPGNTRRAVVYSREERIEGRVQAMLAMLDLGQLVHLLLLVFLLPPPLLLLLLLPEMVALPASRCPLMVKQLEPVHWQVPGHVYEFQLV